MVRTIMNSSVVIAAVALMATGGASVEAQTPQANGRTRVVVTAPDQVDVQRLVGVTVAGEVAREVGRSLRDVTALVTGLGDQVGGSRDFRAEQRDRQTKMLPIGPNGALELKNVAGTISVKAGSGREAKVEVVRVARGRTDADAKRGLEEVTAEVTQREGRASVVAHYPSMHGERPAYAVQVSYVVEAPVGTRLTIGTVAGDVRVDGIKGETTIDAISGDVTIAAAGPVPSAKSVSGNVTLTDVQSEGSVEVGSISGDVTLQNLKARRLSINCVSGNVVAREVQAQNAEVKGVSTNIEYAGAIAKGGRYELQTHSGSVKLVVTGGSGFEVQGRTFSGRIDADENLGLRDASTGRTLLRGTVGDGGADVVITTFSGSVTISRRPAGR